MANGLDKRWDEIMKLRKDTEELNKELDDYVYNHKLDVTSEEYFKTILEFQERSRVLREEAIRLERSPY